MAKDKEQIDIIKDTTPAAQVDKAKLRRAYGPIESATALLDQAKDILKGEPEKAPAVIAALKQADDAAESVLATLGY
jgi:hypothetical protein